MPRTPRPTLLLFDLDGTLVATDGAGRRAIERAFADLHGCAEAGRFSFAGMTDRAIARQGLESLGVAPDEELITTLLRRYLDFLDDELKAARNFRVLPGVEAALDQAARRPGFAIGLGTGNVVAGAEKKLRHARLWERFTFGGYADDSEQRPALIRVAAERGAARLGEPLAHCRVVVIGDTPRDVDAARRNGFEAFAVATGPIPLEELKSEAPDHVWSDLATPAALAALLDGS